jgi:hypothetical protein
MRVSRQVCRDTGRLQQGDQANKTENDVNDAYSAEVFSLASSIQAETC